MSINASTREFTLRKTPLLSVPKTLIFTLEAMSQAKAKSKTQALGLQIQSGIQNVLQLKTFNNGTIVKCV